MIQRSTVNPNLNVFLVARTSIEFLPSGIVALHRTYRIVDPFRFATNTSGDLMVMGLNAIVVSILSSKFYVVESTVQIPDPRSPDLQVIITMMYLVDEIKAISQGPTKYLKQFWHVRPPVSALYVNRNETAVHLSM